MSSRCFFVVIIDYLCNYINLMCRYRKTFRCLPITTVFVTCWDYDMCGVLSVLVISLCLEWPSQPIMSRKYWCTKSALSSSGWKAVTN